MSYHQRSRITTETVEKNIRQQRLVEDQRRDLQSFSKENANLMSLAASQNRIDQQRRMIQQQTSTNDHNYEESLRRKAYDAKFKELTAIQNQALAVELEKDHNDIERRKREIQKICEESPELKELERQLNLAYLNKERSVQYEEKLMMQLREQERVQAIEDEMEAQRIRSIQMESNADLEKRRQYEEQRRILHQQMNEKKQRLEEARKQIEKDKEMVENIVNKIRKEDEDDYNKRREKQLQTAEMVKNYEIQRREELAEKKRKEKEEEERINQYNKYMEARNEGIAAQKQAKKEEEDRIFKQIVEETERKRKEEEEFNYLRDLLWEEELEAKRMEEDRMRKNNQLRMKEDMMRANNDMKRYKEIQRQKEKDEEERLIQLMKNKFAMDEAAERERERRRNAEKQHHIRLIEQQKDEKRYLYEYEREEELRKQREIEEREEYKQRVIREARARLLQEHAAKLEGFLPAKVFENKEEYDRFYRR